MGVRRHNVVIQYPCRFPGNASEAGRWRFYRSAGREPTNRQHADRHDPLEPSQRPIRGECARPTVRGRAAPVSRHAAVNRVGPGIWPACHYAVREPEGNISAPMLAAIRAADSLTESRARWA